MKAIRLITTTILSLMLVFTMMPLSDAGSVHATAAAAQGGTVASNSESAAKAAFGSSNVTTGLNGSTLTITLNSDIDLDAPVRFVKGNTSDKVVLNLNGHTITGKAGVNGGDYDAATGGNAIEIAAADFDVEITDTSTGEKRGSLIGGKGAVYQRDDNYRYGKWGGNAVFFVNDDTNNSFAPGRLDHGLKVTGGAALIGGAGADIGFDDWANNIAVDGINDAVRFCLEAGRGGDAISQQFTGSDKYISYDEKTFAKICIEDGSATGGVGGDVIIGDSHPMTHTYITGIQAVKDLMTKSPDYSKGYYMGWFVDRIRFIQGNGGNGIRFAAGRKYISVGENGRVIGGKGGRIDYGEKGKFVNRLENYWVSGNYNDNMSIYSIGAGGDAISGWGDIGRSNASPELSNESGNANYWADKPGDADDIGIYVAGTVRGGDSCSTDAMKDFALEAGDGIRFNPNKTEFCESVENDLWNDILGIVFVDSTGSIAGGNGGSAVNGNGRKGGGDGGDGIFEYASSMQVAASTNCYIIKGQVVGGNGGDSGTASYGSGGNAIDFMKDQGITKVIAGNGKLLAGDCGSVQFNDKWSADTVDSENRFLDANGDPINEPAVDGLKDEKIDYYGNITRTDGGYAYARKTDLNGFSAEVTMTPFDSKPTTSTVMACNVTKPSGYEGNVYYNWRVTVSGYTYTSGGEMILDMESAGTNPQSFNLLSNSDYHNMEMMTSYGSPAYHIKAVTADTLFEHVKYNDSTEVTIWCDVILEDGRMVKSNELWFTKNYRSTNGKDGGGSSGGGTDDDRTLAESVETLIDNIGDIEYLDLDWDADYIDLVEERYNELTPHQQSLVSADARAKLEAAVAKIAELRQQAEDDRDAVTTFEDLVDGLNDLDLSQLDREAPEDAAAIAAARDRINGVVSAYDTLEENQKYLVDPNKIKELNDAIEAINSLTDDQIDPIQPPAQVDISDATITVDPAVYTGAEVKPMLTVKVGDEVLKKKDFSAVYDNNIKAGNNAKVTITGKGKYTGEKTQTFTIDPRKITPKLTLSKTSYTWTGGAQIPAMTVKDGNKTLKKGVDYDVTMPAGVNVGNHTLKVTLKGNYEGSKTASYSINPKGTYLSKLKKAKKGFTVKWKKQTAKMSKSRITGYQIQYSLKKNFKSKTKTVTIKGYKKASKKIGKLKKKKTYYVKIRTFMNVGGKTYYSPWSKVKKVKTK